MIDPAELREVIKEYGADLSAGQYDVLYNFGIWYADKLNASEVVLSDWTPIAYDHVIHELLKSASDN